MSSTFASAGASHFRWKGRCATATTNLKIYERSVLEECLSHDLYALKNRDIFHQGVYLVKPLPAGSKLHAYFCSCLGQTWPQGRILTGHEAKLMSGVSGKQLAQRGLGSCPIFKFAILCVHKCCFYSKQLAPTSVLLAPVRHCQTKQGFRILISW